MKSFSCLATLPLLLSAKIYGASNLLPGVTYYDGHPNLAGRLVFLLSRDVNLDTNSTTSAAIYQIDLSRNQLAKVTDSPKGTFHVSDVGDIFWVVFRSGAWHKGVGTNVFVYSKSTNGGKIIDTDIEPRQTVGVGGHVFFTLETVDHSKTLAAATKLLDYDIAHDKKREVELPEGGKWQFQSYDRIHVPRGQTNVLHFYYGFSGKNLAGGKDYRDGYYSLDVVTGGIRWFADLLDDKDDEVYTYRDSDGRFVFFEGPDAPFRGFKFVSSPWDFRATRDQDPKGKDVKVLKTFSRLSALNGRAYMVSQMSPDGRFVLVRLQESSVPKSEAQPGWMNTYFLVNASNGESSILLKDEVEHTTSGSMSAVRWVQ